MAFWCSSHPGGGNVHRWLWGLFWIPLDVRVVSWASSPNPSPSEGDTPLLGSQLKIHPNMTLTYGIPKYGSPGNVPKFVSFTGIRREKRTVPPNTDGP